MVMTAGILGAFASLDLFFFYAFHEFALIPTFIKGQLRSEEEYKQLRGSSSDAAAEGEA